MSDEIEFGIADVIDMRRVLEERERKKVKPTDESIWPAPLDLEALAEREPTPPRFIVENMLPIGYATLFAGHGGMGKSQIALMLAVCIASGKPFFGIPVERRFVLYLACEDRVDILHWRLRRICEYLQIDLAGLRGWLDILDLVGANTVLWSRDPRTGDTITLPYSELAARVKATERELIIMDGIADVFAGNMNALNEVKAFINAQVALIPPERGGVLMVGHTPKANVKRDATPTTENYFASVGWHNGPRARWFLSPETEGGEDGPTATGDLILTVEKANIGAGKGKQMRFAWDQTAGLFVGRAIVPATASDHAARDRVEREAILKALTACANATPPIEVPAATSGQRTAYHVLSIRSEFPDSLRGSKNTRARFWKQVESLRQQGRIAEVESRGLDRHKMRRLVICGNAGNAL